MKPSLKCAAKQVWKFQTLLAMNFRKFDVASYIENVAYNKANKAYKRYGQKRADSVYQTVTNYGWRLWNDLTRSLNGFQAEYWFRKQFGNEVLNEPSETSCNQTRKACLKPGPEMWANSVKDDFKTILKKLNDFTKGTKSEKNKGFIVKSLVDMCNIFVAVEPDFYNEERHGKYLPKSEFNSMLQKCGEIISQFG
jgi:hypothetical protein